MGSISSCKVSPGRASDLEGLKKLVSDIVNKHNQLVGETEVLSKDLTKDITNLKSKIK